MVGMMAERREKSSVYREIGFPKSVYDSLEQRRDKTGVPVATQIKQAIKKELAGDLGILPAGVPVLGVVHAGRPQEQDEIASQSIYCSEHPSGPDYAYLKVEGNCLDRRVPPGAFVLIHRRAYVAGQVVVARIAFEDYTSFALRIIEPAKNGDVYLRCDSTDASNKDFVLSETGPARTDAIWIRPTNAFIEGVFTGDYLVAAKKS